MRLTPSHSRAPELILLAALAASAATRPHYGGTLRLEIREAVESPDPIKITGFTPAQWDAPQHAVYTADETAPGGRPFIDSIDFRMGRRLADQTIDLDAGKADIVEIDASESRRNAAARKLWTSSPVRILLLLFGARVDDPRVREALALAVDRAAIHNVLLQRQGEISGALLPQWISGYAFLFPAAQDVAHARTLLAGVPAQSRTLTLGVPDTAHRRIADRIAINARDVGLTVTVVAGNLADVRLMDARATSVEPGKALSSLAGSLGLPITTTSDSPDAIFNAERTLLEGFRVVPLFHLPDVYAASPRVKGIGISPLGEWRFDRLWLDPPRP